MSERLQVSRALILQLDPRGFWLGSNSVSRPPQRIGDDALPVLAAFARPASFETALESLQEEWELDREELRVTVEKLVELGFLRAADAGAPASSAASLARDGFANLIPHYHMVRDRIRVGAYRAAIERHCAGKSVLEIGCGSGILSILAAKAGARRVVAVEESEIASLARRMFEANGCADLVELRLGNSRDVEIEEPVDVIVHEILGTDPLAENLIPYLDDARRRFLKPGGRLIPHRLEVACAGVEIGQGLTAGRERSLAEVRQLADEYGMSFDPLLEDLARILPDRFPGARDLPSSGDFEPRILTAETVLWDLDLGAPPPTDLGVRRTAFLEVRETGRLEALIAYFRAHLDEETVLSTSPRDPRTHWGRDVRALSREVEVVPGERVALAVDTRLELGLQRVSIDLE